MIDFSLRDINTDHPSLWSAAYVLLMAFVLSSVLAVVYHVTTARRSGLGQFIQTMILGSISAAVIVLAIGDSVGRGLGILGALAIIRFRTTLKQQRDIVFVFSALGVGMACGMYGFNVAVIGTGLLSILALLFRLTPLNGLGQTRYMMRIAYPLDSPINDVLINEYLTRHRVTHQLLRKETLHDIKSQQTEVTYLLSGSLPNETNLIQDLLQIDDKASFRIWSRNENEND